MNNIQVILGENGQGKTRYLVDYFDNNRDSRSIAVISNALSNTIFRPYLSQRGKHHNYNFIRSINSYLTQRHHLINRYLNNLVPSEDSINDIFMILNHIGFDDGFSIRVRCNYHIEQKTITDTNQKVYVLVKNKENKDNRGFQSLGRKDLSNIIIKDGFAEKYKSLFTDMGEDNFIFLRGNYQITYQAYLKRLDLENELRMSIGDLKYEVLFSSEFFFSKNSYIFPVSNASSGELYMITLGLFIKNFLNENKNSPKTILIDEPENSLHPKWQKEYIPFLKGFISYHDVDVIIATHSPFIVMKNSDYQEQTSIYSISNGSLEKMDYHQADNSIEQIYYELFGVLTPKNRYLSDYCNSILKNFASGKISLSKANNALSSMYDISFDKKQKGFIKSIIEILNKINGGEIESI